MQVVVRVAPRGIEAGWFKVVDDDGSPKRLIVLIREGMDEVTRQRYIDQARREAGIERRRRGLIPLLPIGWGRTASSHNAATTAAISGGILVVGVAAATVLPAVLTDDNQSQARHPRAAAPARPSTPPKSPQKPPRKPTEPPGETPTRPGRSAESPPRGVLPGVPALHRPSVPQRPVGRTVPVDNTGPVPTPPHALKPPAPPSVPPTQTRPLLRVALPPVVSASVRLSPRLQVRVRVGSTPTARPQP